MYLFWKLKFVICKTTYPGPWPWPWPHVLVPARTLKHPWPHVGPAANWSPASHLCRPPWEHNLSSPQETTADYSWLNSFWFQMLWEQTQVKHNQVKQPVHRRIWASSPELRSAWGSSRHESIHTFHPAPFPTLCMETGWCTHGRTSRAATWSRGWASMLQG